MSEEIKEVETVVDEDGWEINPNNFVTYDGDDADNFEESDSENQAEAEEVSTESESEATEDTETESSESSDDSFTLKYMDEEKTVNRDEITVLAQKGMDYDRVRSERDNAKTAFKTYEAFLKELAESNNSTIEELINNSRARMKIMAAKKDGKTISEMEAMNMVLRESKERNEKFSFDDSSDNKTDSNEGKVGSSKESKRQQDFKDFVSAYPDVDVKTISKSVWDDYNNGKGSLVGLYARSENKALKERIAVLEQNQKNAERSTGSRKSAGKQTGKSMIQELWDADDS